MKFSETLNNYIEKLDCKAKDICKKSGISAATLSRYRSGERLPEPNSEPLKRLCAAISEIARDKGVEGICIERVLEEGAVKKQSKNSEVHSQMRTSDTFLSKRC